jgi:hypothetical protein
VRLTAGIAFWLVFLVLPALPDGAWAASAAVRRDAFLSQLLAARGFETGPNARENAAKILKSGIVPDPSLMDVNFGETRLAEPVTRREALRWAIHSLGLSEEARILSEFPSSLSLSFKDLQGLSAFEGGCLAVAVRMTPPLFGEREIFGPDHKIAPDEARLILDSVRRASQKLALRASFSPMPGMEIEIHREGTFSDIPKWRVYVDGFDEKAEVDDLQKFFTSSGFKMQASNPNYEWRLGSELFEDYLRAHNLLVLAKGRGKPSRVLSSLRNTNLENQPLYWALLVIDPSRYVMRPIVSPLGITALAPLSFIARTSKAAINGGFFAVTGRNRGLPIGVLRIDRSLVSGPYQGRTNLGWNEDNHAAFGEIAWHGRARLNEGGEWTPINSLNHQVKGDAIVMYNSHYGVLTPTSGQVTEIVVENGECVSVNATGGTSARQGRYVLAGYGAKAALLAEHLRPGDKVEIESSFNGGDPIWETMNHIIQAGPFLIRGSEIKIEPEGFSSSILTLRHPRSAMGLTEEGKWFFFVGDGRDGMHSAGFTLQEVAAILRARGAAYALNLDGGGSSQLMIGDKILNSPSEKRERPISYGIGAQPRDGG